MFKYWFMAKGFNTRAVHSGEEGLGIDVVPPIHLSSTFRIESEDQDYIYTRTDNPTRRILEDKVAVLEGGTPHVDNGYT